MMKIGHRGAAAHAPENTLASFRKALELGVDGVEFDIQLSRDGEPMVIHDDTLNRTTSGRGRVSDYTCKELQAFDAGGGEKIPHLNEVFELANRRCQLMIELKANAVDAVDKIIREQVGKGWRYDQLWVLSFHHEYLAALHRLNPGIRLCASFEDTPSFAGIEWAAAIGPNFRKLTPALIDEAHRRNLRVITWTVNKPADIARVAALGVDAIISDYPERL